ncbi:MAG: putative hemolysin [Glaciecola sp.]|jgi:putative hemolysin|uniref:lysophospholipid acyltransferase family protein n=1 Tax=Congregibacter sp. TaxID=2744308 RepID=UPI0039E27C58
MLNVQRTLETRYPDFFERHRRTAQTLSRFLGFLFYETRFQNFSKQYPHLQGFEFIDQVLRYFNFDLRLTESERARIPSSGSVVIAANHPIGSLDGLALLNLVRSVRPDVKVVANDLLTAIGPLLPVLLPVINMGAGSGTARDALRAIKAHLQGEGALIIFPAGEVSRLGAKGVRDCEWQSGFVKLARSTQSPILPVYVAGRNSLFFYSLSALAKPLSTIWLVREMFKQSHNTIDARIGRPVPYDVYSANGFSARQLARMFRKHVYRLGTRGRPIFRSVETVAAAENRVLLRQELAAAQRLGDTRDGKGIFLCRMDSAPCVMREIGRLREMTFRTVGEGCGQPRDIDRFDRHYEQLVLWDDHDMEIVGAYRLVDAGRVIAQQGVQGLYSHTLFDYGPAVLSKISQGLEMGRSFVQPRYQTRHSLDYLWFGIGAYIKANPHIRYLFGPASISRFYGTQSTARLVYYFGCHYSGADLDVTPRTPFVIPDEIDATLRAEFTGVDADEDFKCLRQSLAAAGLPLPTLYKHYSQATSPDGVAFTAFNVDRDFGDCVDSFVIADLHKLTPRKRQRYLA